MGMKKSEDLVENVIGAMEELFNLYSYLWTYDYYTDSEGRKIIKELAQLLKQARRLYGELQYRIYDQEEHFEIDF